MILTGKALEDFNKWNYENDFGYIDNEPTSLVIHFNDLDENLRNTIIIDFFDSVGIYIILLRSHISNNMITGKKGIIKFRYNIEDINGKLFECESNTFNFKYTRQEATEKAIIKANEIYNERTNISNKI